MQRLEQDLLQAGAVFAKKAALRSLDHARRFDLSPHEQMTAGRGKLADEFPLGSAISLAKRVDGIDFAQVICSAASTGWRG